MIEISLDRSRALVDLVESVEEDRLPLSVTSRTAVIQSKCGVRFADSWQSRSPSDYFDCSRERIVNSVDGSLRRLGTDHLDILVLNYPDALVGPQEIARAFDELRSNGKVRHRSAR